MWGHFVTQVGGYVLGKLGDFASSGLSMGGDMLKVGISKGIDYIKPDMKQIAVAITHGFEGYIQDGISRGLQHIEDSMGEMGKNIGAKEFSPYGSINYWDKIYSTQRDVNLQLGIAGQYGKNLEANFRGTLETTARLGLEFKAVAQSYKDFITETGINQELSSQQLIKLVEIQAVYGESASKIFSTYGMLGVSIQDSSESLKSLVQESHKIGINSQQVMEKLKQNIGLINTLHFRDGRKGLEEMAKYALQTKISMESVNQMTEKILDGGIEGAIQIASDLQLLGGGFAQMGDAFQIYEKARNSPEEFAKDIQMAASELAVLNKETGEMEIDALGLEKLRDAAKTLGFNYGEVAMGAKKLAQEANVGNLFDSSIRGAADFDDILTKVSSSATWNKAKQTYEVVVGGQAKSVGSLTTEQARQMGTMGTNKENMFQKTVTDNETLGEKIERNFKELKLSAISEVSYQSMDKFADKMAVSIETGAIKGFAEGFRNLGDKAGATFNTTLESLSALINQPSTESFWGAAGSAWNNLYDTIIKAIGVGTKTLNETPLGYIIPNAIVPEKNPLEGIFDKQITRDTPNTSIDPNTNLPIWMLPDINNKQESMNKVLESKKLLSDNIKDSGNSTTRTIIFEMPDGSKKTESFTEAEWTQLQQYVIKFNTGAGSDGYSYK